MYSEKPKVLKSAMTLYVTILKAIEEVIGYYTKHMGECLGQTLIRLPLILFMTLMYSHSGQGLDGSMEW